MKIQNLRGSVILFFAFLSITLSQGAPAKERPIIEAFTENPCCEKVEKAGEISRKLAEEYNAIYITYDAAKETEKAEKYGANVGSVVVNRSVNINVFVVGVENMEEKIRQALGERPEKASPEGVKGETLVSKLRSFGRSFKLQRASLGLLLISSYLLGIFGGLNPCALGVFPMVVGYIAGKDVKVRRSFLIALVMGLGLTFVYMVFGLLVGFGISFTASSTAKLQRYSYGIGGGIVLIMGLHYMRVLKIPFLERRCMKPKATTGLFGAMGVGAMIGLFYSACVFPLLAPVLTFLLSHPSTLSGTGLLSSFGLGLSSPLIALGLMTGGTSDLVLRKIYKRENIVAKVSGGVLVLVGIWFLWTLFRIIT